MEASNAWGDELEQLAAGRAATLTRLFSTYRDRLERMVKLGLDRRLYGRVDAADILQEAYIEMLRRLNQYLERPEVSFFVWARQITRQSLIMAHRRHLGQKRDAGQEAAPPGGSAGNERRMDQVAGQQTSPSQAAIRVEVTSSLREAMDGLPAADREVLFLRHFEQLSNAQVAEVLGLNKTAASNRYVRALSRLRSVAGRVPALADET